MDLISVIIPAYNAEDTLAKCLDSLLNQTYKNIEIIVINDGSSDKTKIIIDEYCLRNKRVFGYNIENHGVSYARNLGIDKSNGEYIAFIDSDDFVNIDYFEVLYNRIINDNSDIAICDINYSKHPNKTPFFNKELCLSRKKFISSYFLKYKTAHVIGAPFARLIKSDLIKDNKLRFVLNESYAEDFEFNLSLYSLIDNVSIIPCKLYNYIEGSVGSLSKQNMRKIEYMFNRQIDCLLPRISQLNVDDIRSDIYNQFVAYFMFKDLGFLMQCDYSIRKKYNLYLKICDYTNEHCDINSINNTQFDVVLRLYIKIHKCKFLKSLNRFRFCIYLVLTIIIQSMLGIKRGLKRVKRK